MRSLILLALLGGCGGGPSVPGADTPGPPPGPIDGSEDAANPGDGGSPLGGTMSFAYLVTDPNGPTTCDEVGAVKLEIISTHLLTSQETVQLGPCNAPGTAQTVVLPSGPYGNQLSLIGQFDNVISTQPTNTGVVNDDGSNTFLGTFTFAF